ncbi:MAG: hypothetical protein ACREIT_05590, partial [Tepidisphaeraceae bacterium]
MSIEEMKRSVPALLLDPELLDASNPLRGALFCPVAPDFIDDDATPSAAKRRARDEDEGEQRKSDDEDETKEEGDDEEEDEELDD